MSLQSVRQFFAEHAPDIEIIELNQSTATVALAAAAQYHTNFFHRFRSSMQLAETSQKCRLTRYASHILLIHVTN